MAASASADWDNLITWRLSRYKASTQKTYGSYIPRWTSWLAERRVEPLSATRAHVELWLREVADSGKAPATVATYYDAVASFYKFLLIA